MKLGNIKSLVFVFAMGIYFQAAASTVQENDALAQARSWMADHSLMKEMANAEVTSTETISGEAGYSIYVVSFFPSGYVVLNSDERLALVISFSAESTIDISESSPYSLRPLLVEYCEQMAEKLAEPALGFKTTAVVPTTVNELYGPFLETNWNQDYPYNMLCPESSNPAGASYAGRVPAGCVPVALAQIMNYHRWPAHGVGSYSFTDGDGGHTGTYSGVFSDAYDWDAMLPIYGASGSNSALSESAVSELIYELAVVGNSDFETNGNAISLTFMADHFSEYFYYESALWLSNSESLAEPMQNDLRAGYPCIVSLPALEHAVVADGLKVDNGTIFYHLNYGWGGDNNGWYTSDAVVGGPIEDGIVSIRPKLMAFPATNQVSGAAGGEAELQWIVPKRLERKLGAIQVNILDQQSFEWSSDGSALLASEYEGWEITTNGYSGSGWFAAGGTTARMVLDDVFVPEASAALSFQLSRRLASDVFAIYVSTNSGNSYEQVYEATNHYDLAWEQETVPLGDYAGAQVSLRFDLALGTSYYPSGGVWLDDLTLIDTGWFSWESHAVDDALESVRFSYTETNWDECGDFSVFEVTSPYHSSTAAPYRSYSGDWMVTNYSGETCFYKATPDYYPGYSGVLPDDCTWHVTSISPLVASEGMRLVFSAQYSLSTNEYFRIQLSSDGNVFEELWSGHGIIEDWMDISISLSDYAGQSVYIRMEYEGGPTYYPGVGGVWINSLTIEDTVNADLEGQPVYFTTLTELSGGTNMVAARIMDTNGFFHGMAPSFTLAVAGVSDDGDGMPSDWEELYGLNPALDDAALNPDNDLYNNYQEYVCLTDPTDAASQWLLEVGNGAPTFYGAEGRLYSIDYCTNLLVGSWLPLVSDIVGSNATIFVENYDEPTDACRFYRVGVQLPE